MKVDSLLKMATTKSKGVSVKSTNEEFITVDEAARLFRCSPTTVYRHLKRGNLKAYKFGRRWLISRKCIEDVLIAS